MRRVGGFIRRPASDGHYGARRAGWQITTGWLSAGAETIPDAGYGLYFFVFYAPALMWFYDDDSILHFLRRCGFAEFRRLSGLWAASRRTGSTGPVRRGAMGSLVGGRRIGGAGTNHDSDYNGGILAAAAGVRCHGWTAGGLPRQTIWHRNVIAGSYVDFHHCPGNRPGYAGVDAGVPAFPPVPPVAGLHATPAVPVG